MFGRVSLCMYVTDIPCLPGIYHKYTKQKLIIPRVELEGLLIEIGMV